MDWVFGDRSEYYHADEGIYYLPIDVLVSLKRPTGDGLGLYDEAFFKRPERLGLYPDLINANSVPIGITISKIQNLFRWLGWIVLLVILM